MPTRTSAASTSSTVDAPRGSATPQDASFCGFLFCQSKRFHLTEQRRWEYDRDINKLRIEGG